jgi:hypothetical protein
LTDWVSLGVLAASVPRDAVDEAVLVCGKQARRSDGKLPPHVMVYFAMALALFADDDYEEVLSKLVDPLRRWGCWDESWEIPGSSGITQARQWLGSQPLEHLFGIVAQPVADMLTRGAWVARWRVMSIDGMEWDVPDTGENAKVFGYTGGSGFPKVRVVTLVESGSHAPVGAQIGAAVGKGSGEQSMARRLYPLLDPDMLLLADRNFYSFTDWCQAGDTGAELLWRVGETPGLPVVATLADGSYLSVVFTGRVKPAERERVLTAVRAGGDVPDPGRARLVRVIEYLVPDRGQDGERELICLLCTITDPTQAPAEVLAQAYHDRWEHETGNNQLKTYLRGPGRVLRSQSPDMVRQEIYGYLLTHYALSALICRAATEADIDPDQVKFLRTVRIARRRINDGPAAFSP